MAINDYQVPYPRPRPLPRPPKSNLLRLVLAISLTAGLVVFPTETARAAACSGVSVATSRISSPVMYIDTGISPELRGSYAGYRITNNGPSLTDAWVRLTNFTGGIVGLAPNEDGWVHIGSLSSGSTSFAYFYLAASRQTATAQTHDLEIFEGRPDLGTAICQETFSLTTEETIKASANKVNTVVAGPNPAVLGGIMTMTVTGGTGQVGAAGIFSATPAAAANWPANSYQLVDTRIVFEDSGTFDDTLYVTGLGGSSQGYTAIYTFVATGSTTAPTAVSPVNYISSGKQIKHTDTGSFTSLQPILPAANLTTLAKTVAPSALPASGGKVTYTVTSANSSSVQVVLDDFVDTLPPGASYVAGSARYRGLSIPDPYVSGQMLTFVGAFAVPGNGAASLVYDVIFPPGSGTYQNSVTGHVGSTRIDRTANTSDNSPATASVSLGTPPPSADLSVVKSDSADPATVGDTFTYTITVANAGPANAGSVQVVDPLPSGVDFVSAATSQGVCSELTNVVTCDLGTVVPGSVAISISVTAIAPGAFTNNASVTSSTGDPNNSNNAGSETTTINPSPSPPVARDDAAVVGEDGSVVVDVVANDSDVDGDLDAGSVSVVSGPSNGSVSVDGVTGEITYTPNPNFNGADSFNYQVCDLSGACDTATVSVTVTAINDRPVAGDDAVSAAEDTPVVVDVVANDSDVDGDLDAGSVSVVSGPSNGSVSVDGVTGEITYTPNPNFNGADSFNYQVCDLSGACDTATVNVTVNPVGDPPVARNDSASTFAVTPVVVDVVANDSDVDGDLDAGSVSVVSGPSNGSVSVDGVTGEITYTPDAFFIGTDSLIYQVCDSSPTPLCGSATVTVEVGPGENRPVAENDVAMVAEDGSVVVDVVANDSDVDLNLDAGSVSVVSGPSNGSVSVDGVTGEITYTPNPNFNGADSFNYEICDDTSPTRLCDTATVSVTVNPVNDPPVANDDAVSTAEDTPVVVDVVANDSDVDGNLDAGSVRVVSGPSNGSVSVDGVTGEITYTPNPNFSGVDSFTYEICDTNGTCSLSAATVTTTVVEIDDRPVAGDDAVSTAEDTPVVVDVVANDSDVDLNLDAGSVSVVSGPSNGSVSVDGVTGEITYTPNPNFNGADSFNYEICDDTSPTRLCDTATVSVTVNPVNDPPRYTGPARIAVSIGSLPGDLPISDMEGDAYTVRVLTGGLPPGVTLNLDGTFSGKAEVAGVFVVTFEVCDDGLPVACSQFTVVFDVALLPFTGLTPTTLAALGLFLWVIGAVLITVPRRRLEAAVGRSRSDSRT